MWNKAFNNGLIGGLLGIALTLLGTVTGLNPMDGGSGEWSFISLIFSLLGFAIWIIFIVRAMQQYRDDVKNGVMSYGQALGTGVLTALVMGIISALYMILHYYVIDPSAIDQIREAMEAGYEESGMTEEQMESSEWIIDLMSSPTVLAIMSVFSTVFMGLLISFVAAAVTKRDAVGS
jgi:hypothetical protein